MDLFLKRKGYFMSKHVTVPIDVALSIFVYPYTLEIFVYPDAQTNKYGFSIKKRYENRLFTLMECAPQYEAAERAILGIKDLLVSTMGQASKELADPTSSIGFLFQFQHRKHSNPLTSNFIDQIIEVLNQGKSAQTWNMIPQ